MRRLGLVCAAVVAAACGDMLGAGGGRVSLALVPSFSDNVYELITGDLDVLGIRITRLGPTPAVVFDTSVAVDTAGNVDLDASVVLDASTDSFQVELFGIRSTDHDTLYRGVSTVVVTAGGGTPPSDTIPVVYTGPCAAAAGCRITVAPQDSVLTQGDSLLLRAVVDSAGTPVNGVPVALSDLTPSLVAVSQQRFVRALGGTAGGAVRVAATIHGAADTLRLTVLAQGSPVIGVNPASVTFNATAGGANPAAQAVAITNVGANTLSGLSASISYQGGQPTGWLSSALDATTAPTNDTLKATLGSLAVGTYNATVTVSSSISGVVSKAVAVTFMVSAGPPAFVAITQGYATLKTGGTVQLSDTVRDGSGNLLSPSVATWTSRTPGVATVSGTGLVTGVAAGTAVIVASAGTGADSISVEVGSTAADSGHGNPILLALTNGRTFGTVHNGAPVRVDILLDAKAVASDSIGSLQGAFVFDSTVLHFDSLATTGSLSGVAVNAPTADSVRFAWAGVQGATVAPGASGVIHLWFTPRALGNDVHLLGLSEMSQAGGTFHQFCCGNGNSVIVASGSATVTP